MRCDMTGPTSCRMPTVVSINKGRKEGRKEVYVGEVSVEYINACIPKKAPKARFSSSFGN
jgi:hypothetical protein